MKIIYSLRNIPSPRKEKISKSIYTIAKRLKCEKIGNILICPDEESVKKIIEFLKIHNVEYAIKN